MPTTITEQHFRKLLNAVKAIRFLMELYLDVGEVDLAMQMSKHLLKVTAEINEIDAIEEERY